MMIKIEKITAIVASSAAIILTIFAVFQNIQMKKVKDKYSSMEQQFNEFKNQQKSSNIKNNEVLQELTKKLEAQEELLNQQKSSTEKHSQELENFKANLSKTITTTSIIKSQLGGIEQYGIEQ